MEVYTVFFTMRVLAGSYLMAYEDWAFGTLSWRQDIGNIYFGKRKSSIKYNQPIMAQLPTMSKFQKWNSGHAS